MKTIMKKAYITPATEMVTTGTTTLFATSIRVDNTKSGNTALVGEDNDWNIWEGDDYTDIDE